MTDPDLSALKALAEKATPGPWVVNSETGDTDLGEYVVYGIVGVDPAIFTYDGSPAFTHTEGMSAENAEFIVALVNAWPALLARVEEAEGKVAEAWDEGARAGFDHFENQHTPSGKSIDPPLNPHRSEGADDDE